MPRQRFLGALLLFFAAFTCAAMATAVAAAPAAPSAAKPVELDMKLFSELPFRAIGPTNMGGRVSDIAGVESDPATMFVATGTGGVFTVEQEDPELPAEATTSTPAAVKLLMTVSNWSRSSSSHPSQSR